MENKIDHQTGNIVNVGTAVNPTISGNTIHLTIQQQAGTSLPVPQPTAQSVRGYITDSGADRYLLDDYSGGDEFEFYPDPLSILSLYFITLAVPHEDGKPEYFEVLDFVSYCPNVKNGRFNDDIWSVPYTIHPIDLKNRRVRSVQEIKSVYEQEIKALAPTLAILEQSLFYNLGIVYKELEKGREYIEYKRCMTEPNKMRCNYVREFFVRAIDNNGILNLADPENLHQHRYLPLPINAYEYNGYIHFMDKPMPTNVTDVLQSKLKRLLSLAVTVDRARMVYERKGILFRISYIVSTTLSENDCFFDPDVRDILESCLSRHGIGWFQIEGNQILGALPQCMDEDALESHGHPAVFPQYFGDVLNDIYDRLSSFYPWLKNKLCCSLTFSSFRYGKLYSLRSRCPGFEINGDEHFWALHQGLLSLLDAMSFPEECDHVGPSKKHKGEPEDLFTHGILAGVDLERDPFLLPSLRDTEPIDVYKYDDGDEQRTLKFICRKCLGFA